MKKNKPARLTRRMSPLMHKPRRHGTRSWITWLPEARMAPMTWRRLTPRPR